jgi:hypothetical protein
VLHISAAWRAWNREREREREKERDLGLEIVMACHAFSLTKMGVVDSKKRELEDLNDLVQPKLKLLASRKSFLR